MSDREKLAERIADYIRKSGVFPACLGVATGLYTPSSGRGRARQVLFGGDNDLRIWSASDLSLRKGAELHNFSSEEDFYAFYDQNYGSRPLVEVEKNHWEPKSLAWTIEEMSSLQLVELYALITNEMDKRTKATVKEKARQVALIEELRTSVKKTIDDVTAITERMKQLSEMGAL